MLATKQVSGNIRTFENPVIGDIATFIKTSEETNGEYTLTKFELAPGGGNFLHYHTSFAETFEVIKGSLTVQVGKEIKVLKQGEIFTVKAGLMHSFRNKTNVPVEFLVELRPGHAGFEKVIKIGYGLARDGHTNSESIPKNFYHLALLITMGDTYPAGVFTLLTPVLKWAAKRAHKKGVANELIDRYT